MVLKKTVFSLYWCKIAANLLGAGVLGDSLGTFRDGVFGQFTREEEPDGVLDLPGSLVVVGQAGSFSSDTFHTWASVT